MRIQRPLPDFSLERAIMGDGCRLIAGVDEVGRGALAGPVVACAVILRPDAIPDGLDDSKRMSASRREKLHDAILATSHVSVSYVAAHVIDATDIRRATLQAMTEAVAGLPVSVDHVLFDGSDVPVAYRSMGTNVIKGDQRSQSIAAASIVAKVVRDRLMADYCITHPGYGFSSHAGYGTPVHLAGIERLGACPIHRMTFAPLSNRQVSFAL